MRTNDPRYDIDPSNCPEHESAGLGVTAAELKSFDPVAETLEAAAKHGYSVTLTMFLSPPEPMEGRVPVGDPPTAGGDSVKSDSPKPDDIDRVLATARTLHDIIEALNYPPPSCSQTGLTDIGDRNIAAMQKTLAQEFRVISMCFDEMLKRRYG